MPLKSRAKASVTASRLDWVRQALSALSDNRNRSHNQNTCVTQKAIQIRINHKQKNPLIPPQHYREISW